MGHLPLYIVVTHYNRRAMTMNATNLTNFRLNERLFGIFFIITFLAYGTGSTLINNIVTTPDFLNLVPEKSATIIFAGLLMAVVHTAMNIALPVLMLPILKQYSPNLAYGYLGLGIAATVILAVGVVFLWLLLPLSDGLVKSGGVMTDYYQVTASLLTRAGFMAYNMGMALWGLGGLLFVSILYRYKLLPRFVSIWGLAGYVIFIGGTLFELFGFEYGLMMSAPGGLFEIFLSLWLIFKGFSGKSSNLT